MNQWLPIALFAGVLTIPAAAAAIDRSSPTVTKVVTTSAATATESAATDSEVTDASTARRAVGGHEAAPAPAMRAKATAAGHVERVLAGQTCREQSFEDAAEFRVEYGRGAVALQRCIAHEIRDAQISCRQEAVEDPADYRSEYGTGAAARGRCVRDELS
jgi:hypothetical protein